MSYKIVNVVGARPNFMKIAPLMAAYRRTTDFEPLLVHTGQHYDEKMSDLFFRQLGIPEPDTNLGVGSGSHAQQTAQIMVGFEEVIREHQPDAVLVVGDVNSTIACGLVAVKRGVKLIHVEAGLRSRDRSMPEEINRLLTDAISDLLFCTEQSGVDNLIQEGVDADRVFLVGNLMIDTLLANVDRAKASTVLDDLGLEEDRYAVLTLHRPSNVDDPSAMARILDALEVIQAELSVVCPMHPRTRKNIEAFGLTSRLEAMPGIRLIDPVGYLDFLKLMSSARLVLSDSGGIQEETTILGVPCLTLRENTERPVTLDRRGNRLVGNDKGAIVGAYQDVRDLPKDGVDPPPMWDGKAADRIVEVLQSHLLEPAAVRA